MRCMHSPTFIGTVALPGLLVASIAHAQTLADLAPRLATLTHPDGVASDQFGFTVAISGDTMAVGCRLDNAGGGSGQGSVRVFVRSNGVWSQQATLTAADGATNDFFGSAIAIAGDTIAVGVAADDVGANVNQGSVRVFVRNGTTWSQQATLTAADGAVSDGFGSSVALSGDTLVVGVPNDTVGANSTQGSVRIYTRSQGVWSAQTTLTAADGATTDNFGNAVALSGNTLAVGVEADTVGANADQGSVRLFTRSQTTWTALQTLTASDGAALDRFGSALSFSGDSLAVGVGNDDVGANFDQGSVRIFVKSGASWQAQATLVAASGKQGDQLGDAVALSGDTVVAGAPFVDVDGVLNLGAAHGFARSGITWREQAQILPPSLDAFDHGRSVAIDGDTIAVGAFNAAVGNNPSQGTVFVHASHRVLNVTRNTGHDGLASAFAAGFAGDRLLAGAPAFADIAGVLDSAAKRFAIVALEPVAVPPAALLSVASGTVFENSPDVALAGLTVQGKLVAPASGTVTFEQLAVGAQGQFLQRGATVLVNQSLASEADGVCYLQGPVLAESVTTAVGGQNRVAGDTDVFANYFNAGATVVQRGVLYIYGSLVNTGTMTGEVDTGYLPPAAGDGYSIGGDYAVSAGSSLVLPNPVWWLRVGGDLDIAIDDPARFVMNEATIELTGLGDEPSQSLEVFARDLGAVDAGFATTNFLLGALRVRAGATVELADSRDNAPGKGQEAIYTNALFVPAGATLVTNGYRIYTRTATIAGAVSNPDDIVIVPDAPTCPADLLPDGIVNAADLGAILVNWGPCTGSCLGDLDGDNVVGASDLAAVLVAWGPCGAN